MMKIKTAAAVLTLLFISFSVQAQTAGSLLAKADSLYEQRNYTEAYTLYEQVFRIYQKSSPEMLAKMAFINEGLGDHGLALYYLNLYYLKTSRKAALQKMEELANEHRLTGYEFTDFEFFLNLYHRYFVEIVYFFLALGLLFFGLLYYRKNKGKRPVGLATAQIATLLVLLFLINFGARARSGIIVRSDSYLMTAPSAAAKVVEVVDKGHKIRILNEKDVWLKVRWRDQVAFIKRNAVAQL